MVDITVGTKPVAEVFPAGFKLEQNYPNPFNPSTTIKFDVPKTSFVKLVIYDVLGSVVEVLLNQEMKAGNHSVNWDASKYSSGVYFFRLETGEYSDAKEMVLLK